MSNILKSHNDFSFLKTGKFNKKELDVFIALCFKLQNQEDNTIDLEFAEIGELIEENKNPKRIGDYVRGLNSKLAELSTEVEVEPNVFTRFVFFQELTTNYNSKKLKIKVNEPFKYMLNNLTSHYSRYELKELVNMSSSYSANLFKILKTFENGAGWCELDFDKFKELLGIPSGYRIFDIKKKILDNCLQELSKHFFNIDFDLIKVGKEIKKIKFTWKKSSSKLKIETESINQDIIQFMKQYTTFIWTSKHDKAVLKYKYTIEDFKFSKSILKPLNDFQIDKLILNGGIKKKNLLLKKKTEETNKNIEPVLEQTQIKTNITHEEYQKMFSEFLNKKKETKLLRFAFDQSIKSSFQIIDISQIVVEERKELFSPAELLGKNGKALSGMALQMRIKKLTNNF